MLIRRTVRWLTLTGVVPGRTTAFLGGKADASAGKVAWSAMLCLHARVANGRTVGRS